VKPPEPAPQKTELPNLQAPKFGKAMLKIDGKLDEPEWQKAGFTGLRRTGDGKTPPDQPGECSGAFGLGRSEQLRRHHRRRQGSHHAVQRTDKDPHIWEKSSAVEVLIQPGDPATTRTTTRSRSTTAGAIFDTHFRRLQPAQGRRQGRVRSHGLGEQSQGWREHRKGKGLHDRAGHSLGLVREAARGLAAKPGDVWRINIFSFKDGQKQALGWSPVLGQGNFPPIVAYGQVAFVLNAGAPTPAGSASAARVAAPVRLPAAPCSYRPISRSFRTSRIR